MLAIPCVTGPRARSPHIIVSLAAVLGLAAPLFGCGGKATRTVTPAEVFSTESPFSGSADHPGGMGGGRAGGATSYPLAVGNRWDYALHSRVEIFPTEGEPSATQGQALWSAQIVGTAISGNVTHFLLAEGDPRTSFPPPALYFIRQDQDGLYEVDTSPVFGPSRASPPAGDPLAVSRATLARLEQSLAGTPHATAFARAAARVTEKLDRMRRNLDASASAATEAMPNELTVLRYPLRIGSEWVVRDSPRFGRIVVGLDDVRLPVGRVRAWRLLGVSELYNAEDRVHFWYGRAGLVRIHLHAEMEATDDSGNTIGKAIAEYDQSLTRFTGSQ
jgi:hypothetical protein